MEGKFEVRVKVISQQGRCSVGHRVGDEWVTGGRTPEGICLNAFGMLLPNIRTLMFGGVFPVGTGPGCNNNLLSRRQNPVVFELRRIRE